MEKCKDLLPDYFSFVKGLVDSEDLSLNISRELLQHDRQLKAIARSIEKSIKNELTKMLRNDREKYEKFWSAFGVQLKYGAYSDYGMHKDVLQDLLLFTSSNEDKLVTLDEYVTRMPEDQKYIYYATGTSIDAAKKLPQTELVKEKGYEILYLTENVDEFTVKFLREYKEKQFKSVNSDDLDLETEEEKNKVKEAEEANKDLFEKMKSALGEEVVRVKASSRLKNHPVCLSSEGEISLEMEKVLNNNPGGGDFKAQRVLEVNPEHPIFEKLRAMKDDEERLGKYSKLLYDQALLIEGMPVKDPVAFSNLICELM
jgi:molecular chaperone HtpG